MLPFRSQESMKRAQKIDIETKLGRRMQTSAPVGVDLLIDSDVGCTSSTSRRNLAYLAHQYLDRQALLGHAVVPVVVPRLNAGQSMRLQMAPHLVADSRTLCTAMRLAVPKGLNHLPCVFRAIPDAVPL